MRKLSFFLAFALVLTFAFGAMAQNAIISIDNVTNEYAPSAGTQLIAGTPHVVSIRYDCSAIGAGLWIGSNGFKVYSPDGADWGSLQGAQGPLVDLAGIIPGRLSVFAKHFDRAGGVWTETGELNPGDGNGTLPTGGSTGITSAAGFYLATISVLGNAGYETGQSDIAVTLAFSSRVVDHGLTMCIDTNNQITAWEWAAGTPQDFPNWDNGLGVDGPRCYEIFAVPNIPAYFSGALSANVSGNHCGELSLDVAAVGGATDDDAHLPGNTPLAYNVVSGGGAVDANGVWTWSGAGVPQSGNSTVEIRVEDGLGDGSDAPNAPVVGNFFIELTHENNAPTIECPAGIVTISLETMKSQTVTFGDVDVCDVATISVTNLGGAAGAVVVNGNDIEFTPVVGDEAPGINPIVMEITVTDGDESASCTISWNVIAGAPYAVEIEKVKDQIQGQFTDVALTLHKINFVEGLGGFDFLVAYDASALVFQMAYEGDVYDDCNWEYFTYRFGANGNCGGACPSGLLRVIGIAETNNGAVHPGCDAPDAGYVQVGQLPITLAELRFLVTNDRTLECQYVPIRFFWNDCGDNILSNHDGSEAYLSAGVFDFFAYNDPFVGGEITGADDYPTYQGAQDGCILEDEEKDKIAIRNVDFQNGGVDIVCADSIDARGDINLNGLAHEIADAVMFTNYFITGLSAFGTHIDGSIAASDVNADGIALSVADLVYLVRVVIGDAPAYDKVAPVTARVTRGDDIFSVNTDMGAAYIVVAGNVVPELLGNGMEMKYKSNGSVTNILVFSTEGNSFNGEFLRVAGEVVSTEFATNNGSPVVAKLMPTSFVVAQNYPNPFNPTTNIKFDLPGGGAWKVGIYNITGQLVDSFEGVSESGFETLVWDASELSSGIYFYRVTAGDHSMTKKAVLLK